MLCQIDNAMQSTNMYILKSYVLSEPVLVYSILRAIWSGGGGYCDSWKKERSYSLYFLMQMTFVSEKYLYYT